MRVIYYLIRTIYSFIFIFIIVGTTYIAPARAQDKVLESITDCDVLAAHPDDPQRVAQGVADDQIVHSLAIEACNNALKAEASQPRFAFQLGRAKLASGLKAEATLDFRKAADVNYAAAWAYLGDAFQFGHVGQPAYQDAANAYSKALQLGFQPAKGLLEMMFFDKSQYGSDLIDLFYTGDFRELQLRVGESPTRHEEMAYIFAFSQKAIAECTLPFAAKSIAPLYVQRMQITLDSDVAKSARFAGAEASGEYDATIFLKKHGCESPVSRQVFGNFDRFMVSK